MPARPTQGGSSGSWGAALNANLDVSIDATTGALVPAAVRTALSGSRPFVGSADPSSTLTAGTEYVWFQTDGAGTLLDILVGVA